MGFLQQNVVLFFQSTFFSSSRQISNFTTARPRWANASQCPMSLVVVAATSQHRRSLAILRRPWWDDPWAASSYRMVAGRVGWSCEWEKQEKTEHKEELVKIEKILFSTVCEHMKRCSLWETDFFLSSHIYSLCANSVVNILNSSAHDDAERQEH